MTTPRQRIAELTRIQDEREESAAWYIVKRLSGEIPGLESWARETIASLMASCQGGIHGRHLETMLERWDLWGAADYAASEDPEMDSVGLRDALQYAIGWSGWEEPSPSVHADAIADIIAYRCTVTTHGARVFRAGFQLSHLTPLFHRVLKLGFDPSVVKVAEDTQPTYSGGRRYPAVVAMTPGLRDQLVAALTARGFASELFKMGSSWHIRSV
jgi:hypothetical protein